ncbi:MAG: class II fructose-bisphosphate aldolase family protein [Proteobacteria bacterium]|nr:class II fructose-bisphosphate aldolase family protein [Pseudomonadota bacterium]
MLTPTMYILQNAQANGYAIGAFNVYNLEGALAVVAAAEAADTPAMLQIHPGALKHGGTALVALCLKAAEQAAVPMSVHLDHCSDPEAIRSALAAGLTSIMADGSHFGYEENVAFTRDMAEQVHAVGGVVEAELGRLAGTEDDLTVEEYEARLTDPAKAVDFVARSGADLLAVCIGNIHGRYPRPPQFDYERLAAIRDAAPVPLVLHGTSGVPDDLVRRCIKLGVCKFNVNTEVRQAYIGALREHLVADPAIDLVPLMRVGMVAMQEIVAAKLRIFSDVDPSLDARLET